MDKAKQRSVNLGLRVLFSLLAACSAAAPVLAQADAADKSLAGLTAVTVAADSLDPAVEREGLTRDLIQREVEQHLRDGGMSVLAPKEGQSAPGQARLYVGINIMKGSPGIYNYSLELSLQERVKLEREPQTIVTGETWSTGSIGMVGTARIGALITKITDLADDFLQAWRAMNPKK